MPCGPWKTLNEISDLRTAIRSYNFQQQSNLVNWQNDILAMTAMEAYERQAEAEVYADELATQYRMGSQQRIAKRERCRAESQKFPRGSCWWSEPRWSRAEVGVRNPLQRLKFKRSQT